VTQESRPVEERVRAFLEEHSTMTLATCGGGQPWAAAVYYASSAALELFFVSSESARHSRDVAESPVVAVTVNGEGRDWNSIRGLQIVGDCRPVSAKERAAVEQLYLAKFPAVARVVRDAQADEERKVAERFRGSRFYRVVPRWIRYIDNTRGFAQREELGTVPVGTVPTGTVPKS
jgi:hypothetical protein